MIDNEQKTREDRSSKNEPPKDTQKDKMVDSKDNQNTERRTAVVTK